MQTIGTIPSYIYKDINYNSQVLVCFLHCFHFLWVTFISLLIAMFVFHVRVFLHAP